HFGFQSRMSDDQFAAVEHVMADESVEERDQFRHESFANRRGKSIDLGERLLKTMSDAHVAALEFLEQFHIVVAGNAKCRAGDYHVANDAEGIENPRPAIDQIADEHGLPPGG